MNKLVAVAALVLSLTGCRLTTAPAHLTKPKAAGDPIVVIKDEPRGPVAKPRTDTPDDRPILVDSDGNKYRVYMIGRVGIKEYE